MMTLISFIFIYFTLVYLYYIDGKWVGTQGFVMVAVPAPGSEPKRFGQQQQQQNGQVIHEQNGMFFYLPSIVNNPNNGKPIDKKDQAPYAIGMSASVPHGNAGMMFGDSTDPGLAGAPEIPYISTLPSKGGRSYLAPYNDGPTPLDAKPTAALKDALAKKRKW